MKICLWLRLVCIITVCWLAAMDTIATAQSELDHESATGFVPVFKDNSLDGWHGNTTAWVMDEGRLVYTAPTRPSGRKDLLDLKLMSPLEYQDFILRFEFKLENATNNGIAVRAPLEGDPAFVGMEIQVIDTPNWKGLKSFQVHGSIYGVVQAKTGYLKEPGVWNSEEIFCQGRQLKVTLNGVVIVDANLDDVGGKTLDGAVHPGVKRTSGHIGFLGHTGKAEFRSIRIKDLSKPAAMKPVDGAGAYFPPPESHGGWRKLESPEDVTGQPYDQYAIEHLYRPLGIESWTFETLPGDEKHGKHASHSLGLPAREMARIAYCMAHDGRWRGQQVITAWFVTETAKPTHEVKGLKSFGRDAESWSHGWELPARLTDGRGAGIPADARFKPGSGGQLIAFVPSLDLVVTRQTGSSGSWEFEEYLRLACSAVTRDAPNVRP